MKVVRIVLIAGAALFVPTLLIIAILMILNWRPDYVRDVAIDVSPQGQLLFLANGDGGSDLYTMDLESHKVRFLKHTSDFEKGGSFGRGGEYVVYSASPKVGEAAHIFVAKSDGSGVRQLTFGQSTYDDCPRFSLDGSKIVFSRAKRHRTYSMGGYTWDNWDIYTISFDGRKIKKITDQNYDQAYSPNFYQHDKRIIFLGSSSGDDYNVLMVTPSANPSVPKAIVSGEDTSCSPDVRGQILYISDIKSPFHRDIWRCDADGKNRVQVTNVGSKLKSPVFTHDGKHIIFLYDRNKNDKWELWQVDLNGSGLKKIAGFKLFSSPESFR